LPDIDVIDAPSQLILAIGAGRGSRRVDLGQFVGDGSTYSVVMRGLDPRIHHLHESLSKKMDCRVISREDARSLSSGRALRGPVGAFARQ
jgi:hypothetical protein